MPAKRNAAPKDASSATIGFEAKVTDRVHRKLLEGDLRRITSTYHAWRGDVPASGNAKPQLGASAKKAELGLAAPGSYADIPGFCKSATTARHLLKMNPGDMIVTNTEQGFDHLLIGHAAIVPR